MIRIFTMILIILSMTACNSVTVKNDTHVSAVSQLRMAEAAYAKGDYQEARLRFESVVNIDPTNLESHFKLANIAVKEGKLDEAQAHYATVLKLDSNHARAHHNLAVIYLMQSEAHLNYFLATVHGADDHQNVFELLTAIDAFSNGRSKPSDSLDALATSLSEIK